MSKSGPIHPQYPGKYVVLIALEDLSKDNGLPSWSNSPENLRQGESALLSGDEEQTFRQGGGGGLILLLVFNIHH